MAASGCRGGGSLYAQTDTFGSIRVWANYLPGCSPRCLGLQEAGEAHLPAHLSLKGEFLLTQAHVTSRGLEDQPDVIRGRT